MIKSNQYFFNFLLVVCDILAVSGSLLIAWYIRFVSPFFTDGVRTMDFEAYMMNLLFIVPVYLFMFLISGLYKPYRKQRFSKEFGKIVMANTVSILVVITVLYTIGSIHFSRIMLGLFYGFSILIMTFERGIIRKALRTLRERGYNIKHIIIVGAGALGKTFADKVIGDRQLGYEIRGYIDDYYPKMEKDGIPILGTTREVNTIFEEYRVDEVVIALPNASYKRINEVIDACEYQGIKTQVIPDYFNLTQGSKPALDELDGIPLINTRYIPLDEPINRFIKRLADIIMSLGVLVIGAPFLLVIACLVKITSPGPVIYKQTRIGMDRKHFSIYKFRSMRDDVPEVGEQEWTTEDDPRRTKFGTFIRSTSIDELPQFFNVLKGDMSVIGPRPERPYYVNKFKSQVPKYMIKHHVRPGITGWAQVNGWRGDTSIIERINCDIDYIENWSFWLDIKIFFMTFKALFKNAY